MIADREPFSLGVAASVVLHGALVGAVVFGGSLFPSGGAAFGTPHGGSSGIHVKMVSGSPGIPLPVPAAVNPGDRPSDSPGWTAPPDKPEPPARTKPTGRGSKPEKPSASDKSIKIPVAGAAPVKPIKRTTQPAEPGPPGTERGPVAVAANAAPVNSVPGGTGGTAMTTYGKTSTGAGTTAMAFSEGSFGERFGWYAEQVSRVVSQHWSPTPGAQFAPKITVIFTINRDGTIANLEFERKSNNDDLDNNARRAVMLAATSREIPPLPSEFVGSSIKARLFFEYSGR